jgi:outer membrane protein assembly factor BamA
MAQVTAPVYTSAPTLYEGQPVASVELLANPRIDVAPYHRYIAQPAGAPYSAARVQETLDALNHTGRFTKAEIEVQPEPAGLKLTFVLEPAFYYGLLEFPGATGEFRYTRLLQAVNLPTEEPYDVKALHNAQAALLEFFEKNGFFNAEVDTEPQFDDPHQLVNIIFHVQLHQRARLGEILFNGVSEQQAERLARALRSWGARFRGGELRSGKSFTAERIQAATNTLRSHIRGENYLIRELRVGRVQFHPDTNRADVVFNVQLGPPVSVTLSGARLTWVPFLNSRRLHQLIPVFEESSVDPDLLAQGERNLIDYFQKRGFFDVNVEYQVQNLPSKVAVVYQVTTGRKHRVTEVRVEGNRYFSEARLLAGIPVKEARPFSRGQYSNKLVKQSVTEIATVYSNAGFESAQVTPHVIDREPNIYVTFKVAEGRQTLVEDLHIEGAKSLELSELQSGKQFNLEAGFPFSPARLNQDRDHVVATYLDRGYPLVTFNSTVERLPKDPYRVNVTYVINEGPQVRVDNVLITGNRHTRTRYIARTVAIAPEEPLSQSKLLTAESNLYDLAVFDWASVGPKKPITNQTQDDVVAKVHESRRNSIKYGIGFEYDKRAGNVPSGTVALPGLPPIGLGTTHFVTSEETFFSPRGSVEYIRRNLRGLGETFSISILAARLDQRLLASYTQPQFRETNWRTLVSFSAERNSQNPVFTARLATGTLQFERDLTRDKTKTLQLRYQFQRTTLSNLLVPELVLPQDRYVRLSSLGASFIHDKRDRPLDAHRGMWDTIDLTLNPSALGSNVDFGRLLVRRAIYIPFKNYVWANSLQVGVAKAFAGSRVPTSERFFSGGANSLRGFPVNGAGPQRTVAVCSDPNVLSTCSNTQVPVGGNGVVVFNSELRFPLPIIQNLGGAVFYDGGNVYDHFRFNRLVDGYSNTVGLGVRYSTPIGPLRFDVGRLLNPVPGFRPTQFFFSLGQAF